MQQVLAEGERLLWAGRPARGWRLRRGDWYAIPFSILWAAMVASAMLTPPERVHGSKLWLAPFVVLGLHLLIGRFYWDAWERSHTVYGVTNQRILITTTFRRSRTTSYDLASLGVITLALRSDGSGDVVLAPTDARELAAGGFVPKGFTIPPMLGSLDNPTHVYNVIEHARKAV